ncbi:GGDEF domain-containing protein [Nocardioides sp. W3-2-3]|nr:GGDEF domain-containing protein [Nocardioides convexus]
MIGCCCAWPSRLAQVSGEGDLVARLGGDEFVMVFSGISDVREVRDRIKEIAALLPTSVMVNNHEVLATVSVGCAVYPDHGETPSHLLKNADIAMYRAKAAGRNNVRWFQPEMLVDSNEKSGALRVTATCAGEGRRACPSSTSRRSASRAARWWPTRHWPGGARPPSVRSHRTGSSRSRRTAG